MSLLLRRAAVVSLAALALTAGGTVAASASALPAPVVSGPGPDGFGDDGGNGGGGGGHYEHPLRFGPFEFPRSGSISGGFAWGTGH
ncbi:hypothetical protein AB0I77_26845 [Streptomyces sp. NPDC050619]|uniref:hypothetical protein n=1 Tax=Streptomyces sp. NPDC050619 TaxID=3157214 RepID=UPI00341D4E18